HYPCSCSYLHHTATTDTYPLSLHDALPIFLAEPQPDWPPRTIVTGPILYNGQQSEAGLSPDLEAFLAAGPAPIVFTLGTSAVGADRKSTRLSSSHVKISYAVFCLKKKKIKR